MQWSGIKIMLLKFLNWELNSNKIKGVYLQNYSYRNR